MQQTLTALPVHALLEKLVKLLVVWPIGDLTWLAAVVPARCDIQIQNLDEWLVRMYILTMVKWELHFLVEGKFHFVERK